MLQILDTRYNLLVIITNTVTAVITEEINREYVLDFTMPLDDEKSQYIVYGNIVKAEGQYFHIVYTDESHSSDDILTIAVRCEHLSTKLTNMKQPLGFSAYGAPGEILTLILDGTEFTAGTVEFSDPMVLSINQETNRRASLNDLVQAVGGELKYSGMEISLLRRRGADRGVSFHYRKNVISARKTVDGTNLDADGNPTVTYQFDPVELEFAEGFSLDEHFELGDSIRCYDPPLRVQGATFRIVRESHNVNQWERGKASVVMSNFLADLESETYYIKTTTVVKDSVYNGCSLGPDQGFVSEFSNKKARNTMDSKSNKLELGDGTGNYTPVFYVKIQEDGKAELWLDGNVIFTGTLKAASGTFNGELVAATGTFKGNLQAAGGTFSGDLEAAGGTFSGNLQAATGTFTGTLVAGIVTGATINGGTINGTIINGVNINTDEDITVGNKMHLHTSGFGNGIFFHALGTGSITIADPFTGALAIEPALSVGNGASGSFTSADGKTVIVTEGIVTNIM